MSITDELRKWVRDGKGSLLAIADRIDAEHERELRDTGEDIVRDVRREWVRLPVDADGVPIRVGDVMESKDGGPLFGKGSFEVRAMRYDECGWEVYDRLGDRYAPSLLRHYHEPTVEDVLREFANECLTYATCVDDHEVTDAIELYAAKLRLAGDAE